MAELVDRFGLQNSPMFSLFSKESLNYDFKKSNIMDFRDEMLYVWFNEESILLTSKLSLQSWSHCNFEKYQILKPAEKPLVDIREIQLNILGTQVAAVGKYGINIFQMPNRWGPNAYFTGGINEIIIKSRLITLEGTPYIEGRNNNPILKVRWYPGSALHPYLAVLYSDNCLRFFDTDLFVMLVCIQLGPSPHRPGFSTLGDIAIDYDFAPVASQKGFKPLNKSGMSILEKTAMQLEWPIFILRSNGDVFKLIVDLDTTKVNKKFIIQGPLRMYPQDSNNYGSEANAILVLNTNPPIIVLSRSNVTIYNCVLLSHTPSNYDYEEEITVSDGTLLTQPDCALYVFECIELELGLNLDIDADCTNSSPVSLISDPTSNFRYICSHDAGLHLIKLPIINLLEDFEKLAEEDENELFNAITQTTSTINYVLCTNISNTTKINQPLRGVQIVSPPDILIAVLGNGQVMSKFIAPFELPCENCTPEEPIISASENSEQFNTLIANILKSGEAKNQPLLLLSSCPTIQDTHNLITRASSVFRNNVFHSHKKALEEIESRVKVLNREKAQQMENLKKIISEKEELKNTAEKLADKYEKINDKQQEYTKRAENLMLKVHSLTVCSFAERRLELDLLIKDMHLKNIVVFLSHIRERLEYFKMQANQIEFQTEKKAIFLNNNQSSILRKSLGQMKLCIAQLVDRVNSMNQQMKEQ